MYKLLIGILDITVYELLVLRIVTQRYNHLLKIQIFIYLKLYNWLKKTTLALNN